MIGPYTAREIFSAAQIRAEAGDPGLVWQQSRDELAHLMVGIVADEIHAAEDTGVAVPSLHVLVEFAWAQLLRVASDNRRLDAAYRRQFPTGGHL
jgi:hypothetical protein